MKSLEHADRPDYKGWMAWVLWLVLAVLAVLAAGRHAYFPGDLLLARWIQSIAGDNLQWARLVSDSLKFPINLILLGLTTLLAWRWAGMRGAIILPLSLGLMWLGEPYLKALALRPRPSPTLIRVSGAPTGFSFPSGHALMYFSLFGTMAILAWHRLGIKARAICLLTCGMILLVGGCARVALGAHWPSDILGGWLICSVWVTLLMRSLVKP